MREQGVILEYRINVTRVRWHSGDYLPAKLNLAGIRLFETSYQAQ